jgi:hypothetical protein
MVVRNKAHTALRDEDDEDEFGPRRMFFGLFTTQKGTVSTFFHGIDEPLPKCIVIFRERHLSRKDAQIAANALLVEYQQHALKLADEPAIWCAYGLRRTGIGHVRPFTCVGDQTPSNLIFIERAKMKMSEACYKASTAFVEHNADPRAYLKRITAATARVVTSTPKIVAEAPPRIINGIVAAFSDAEGTHVAIVLNARPGMSHVLMLTSRPGWNAHARLASEEELMFCGRPLRKTTYLAPTDFPTTQMTPLDGVFPAHRLTALQAEFRKVFEATGVGATAAGGPKP